MSRHLVHLVVSTPGELLERFYPNGKIGGLTIDHQPPGALGEFVQLVVRVRKPSREFSVGGQLAWARRKASKQLLERYGVDFLTDDDHTVVRMLAFARAELPATAMRLERRVPAELSLKLLHAQGTRRERLADLSHGGAFVRTWDPLSVDTPVELVVRRPSSIFSLRLKGRVAWVRRVGDAPGMGIAFVELSDATRRELEGLLGRLKR